MESLKKTLLSGKLPDGITVPVPLEKAKKLPEKIVQFGEGVFLRAFVDDFVNEANAKGIFNGRVVIVQPIEKGRADDINGAGSMYTLALRGLKEGQPAEDYKVITSVSRALKAHGQWREVLELAESEEIEIIVSNTTEAGIVLDENDQPDDDPPGSFPAKLTEFLYCRWAHFDGDPDKGMIIIPCELIDRNGTALRKCIQDIGKRWQLEDEFLAWVNDHCTFCNSLVDRIVTGFPSDELEEFNEELGYEDSNLDTAEQYHLWAIEGGENVREKLPLHEAGCNVVFTDNYSKYKNRKVRILNGSHTTLAPLSYVLGVKTVGETMVDEDLDGFWKTVLFNEIIPSLPYPEEEMEEFAFDVIERFKNPFLTHQWANILLNTTSKIQARVLPSILDHIHKFRRTPPGLSFAFAGYLLYMKVTDREGDRFFGTDVNGEKYELHDDLAAMEFYYDVWRNVKLERRDETSAVVRGILQSQKLWTIDLSSLSGFNDAVWRSLYDMLNDGISATLKKFLAAQ